MNKMPCSITDGPQYDDADMTLTNYISDLTSGGVLDYADQKRLNTMSDFYLVCYVMDDDDENSDRLNSDYEAFDCGVEASERYKQLIESGAYSVTISRPIVSTDYC